jgi:NTP pyrophosphatase (non-canonical NTP hydrolase)
MANEKTKLTTTALGLTGEAGEVAEIVKKHLFHGKDFDRNAFLNELSDCLWYITLGTNSVGAELQDVIDINVAKLRSRYKTGKFTQDEFSKKEQAKLPEK